jgi:hypothetical protein
MYTIERVDKINARFKKRSKCFKWIRKHISKKLGEKLLDINYDRWGEFLDKANQR